MLRGEIYIYFRNKKDILMSTTYAQKQSLTQKKDAPSASSVFDASSQNESLQRKADMVNSTAQRVEPPRPNNTGMPDNLKAGIESLSGFSMDDVRVHYNSSKPATVQALAYTQGTDIHVAPGQEKHLPHEAWHVAQQMAGRVAPTTNINGMPVNDNAALEHEADVMGEKAVQCKNEFDSAVEKKNGCMALQRMSFAASPLAVNTLQWESKGTPWHEKPGQRGEKLSEKVDQYKKEMLTYIAKKIEEFAAHECGPHISVVITGGAWYISVNSDVPEAGDATSWLNVPAGRVFEILSAGWQKIEHKTKENFEERVKEKSRAGVADKVKNADEAESVDDVGKEAAYIALRWAVSRGQKIKVVNNPSPKDAAKSASPVSPSRKVVNNPSPKDDAKRIHAEMRILSTLNQECKKDGKIESGLKPVWKKDEERENEMKLLLKQKGEKNVDEALAPLSKIKKDLLRVIRVGGTKIPCFDCFYEMGGKIVIDKTKSYKVVSLGGYKASYSERDSQNVEITDAEITDAKITDAEIKEKYKSVLNGEWSRPDTKSKYERKIDSENGPNIYLCDVFHDGQSCKLTLSKKNKDGPPCTYTSYSGTFKIKDENPQMVVSGTQKKGVKVNKKSKMVLEKGEWTLDSGSGTKYKYKCTYESADYFCDVDLEMSKCHGTLYKKEIGDFSKKNEISSTPCIHDDVGKVVKIGDRNVTTMTSDHSQANNTWCFPGNDTARKADFYEKNGKETNGKETLQDQNFDGLKKACCAIGVDL